MACRSIKLIKRIRRDSLLSAASGLPPSRDEDDVLVLGGNTPKRTSIRNSQVAGLTADTIKEIVATCMHSTNEREDKLAAAITKALQSKESSRKRSNSDAEPWIREEGPEMVKIDRPIRDDAHTTID